ncbi:MAG: hypothetical protein KKH52_01250 [Nanoarchaeota archaeon]|nr:hypothetical protein [Nanoarchaeota archaeon]MBU1974003.1 hypothetical protein [Nanoarchaeota archaeon]
MKTQTIIFLLLSLILIPLVLAYYPEENPTDSDPLKFTGNGRLIQLYPDSNQSKPIISWYDYDSGKQVAWIVAHDWQPSFEGDDQHRHLSIETSKEQLGWVTTRMEFPYGEDIIDIGIVDSNLRLQTGRFIYYNSIKNTGTFYHPTLGSLITYAPNDIRIKPGNGVVRIYSDNSPVNRLKNSELIVYGKGKGDEYIKIGHNGINSIITSGYGNLLIEQNYYTPTSSNEECQPKEIAFDDEYLYLCNSQGKWGRTSLETGW